MNSISFIISSLNNCEGVIKTILSVQESIKRINKIKYNIILIDDFSVDNTYSKINSLKKRGVLKNLVILRNSKNLGFALSTLKGAKKSNYKFIKILHSSNIENSEDIWKYLTKIKEDTILLSYPPLNSKRDKFRKSLSSFCTKIFRLASGLNLNYFQSPILCLRKDFIKTFPKNHGNFFISIIIVKLIFLKKKYKKFPIKYKHKKKGSTAVSFKNFYSLVYSLILILILRIKSNFF